MGRGIEYGIDPMIAGQGEAILQKVLRTRLVHVGIEVAGDDCGCVACLAADDVHHVLRASVALAAAAISDAPVRVEVPEFAASCTVCQLHPSHMPRAPIACSSDVLRTSLPHIENPWLHGNSLGASEG